jgi:regulator of sirC expression with transglutaminase-like and TPR domain
MGAELKLLRTMQAELKNTPVSLATLGLLVSTLEYPEMNVDDELASFRQLESVLSRRIQSNSSLLQKINEISEYFFSELSFSGNVKNYYDHKNSFINEVLNRRQGIPITLAILYMEIASRLGIDVAGIGMPGHFLVRAKEKTEIFYIDVFNKGTVLSKDECEKMFNDHVPTSFTWDDRYLVPVDDKYIIVRLLRNLKYIYLSEDKTKQAYKVMDLIVGLEPDNVFEIRDRGMVGFRVGHKKQSIKDLKRFLEKEPVGRPSVEASSVLELLERNHKKW